MEKSIKIIKHTHTKKKASRECDHNFCLTKCSKSSVFHSHNSVNEQPLGGPWACRLRLLTLYMEKYAVKCANM